MWLTDNIRDMDKSEMRRTFQSMKRQIQTASSEKEANEILSEAEYLTQNCSKDNRQFAEKQLEELKQASQFRFPADSE
ncbi:MAG: hypothetical protein HYY22_01955 [Thaumarchaeota archaeon]|nr:hypothetical protein [Nitrososphaerota archaeon]